jgi:hypothetical protein
VNLLTDQIRDRVRSIFRNTPVDEDLDVRGTWTPGPSVAMNGAALRETSNVDYNRMMLLYLIASNAAMLAALIWLLIRQLK